MSWTLFNVQSLLDWSDWTSYLGFFAFASLVAWWIVRRRLKDLWMPIIRVLELPVSRLPRVIIKKPPMIPFWCFVLSALDLLLWTMKPSIKVFSDFEPGTSQIHVYVDMSPSVSAHISLNELGQKLEGLLEQIGPKARVTFGTSHGDDVYELTTPTGAADLIRGLGFHRGGSKIGAGVRAQVSRIGEIDQLFIISDRDQHSWSGFQWRYLLVDADVRHVDVDSSGSQGIKSNVFIQDARFLSASGALTMDWEVEIAEGILAQPASGTLNAAIGGESLATANWDIPAGRRSVTVTMSWPSTKIPQDLSREPIEWTIEIAGGDSMVMDNKFRTPVVGTRGRVVVMGEPTGELRLEDLMMPLETALQVTGHEVSRFDRWPSIVANQIPDVVQNAQLLVAMTGDSQAIDFWCPDYPKIVERKKMPLWLSPRSLEESFTPLCECVAKYGMGLSKEQCSSGLSRNQWIDLLSAWGAKQVGGTLGSEREAIAMKWRDAAKGLDLTMFSIPLRPDAKLGLTWGTFPLMIKSLASFTNGQPLLSDELGKSIGGTWPRIADISQVPPDEKGSDLSRAQLLRETNVPAGESALAVVASSELPPTWSAAMGGARERIPNKRDSQDPWPWVKGLAALVGVAMIIEMLWLLRRLSRERLAKIATLGMMALTVLHANDLRAQARIDWLDSKESHTAMFQSLSREVSGRTSLELSEKPDVFTTFDEAASERPWIWTSTPLKLANSDGRLSNLGRLWLKRGGILMIDGSQSDELLDRLMEPLMSGTVKPSGWRPMPPDHEFMRSFYLLNSLPTCKSHSWKIFSFDGRVAAISIPYSLLLLLQDQPLKWSCEGTNSYEQHVRIFVNLMMMSFTTDYKRDQIHLPEILKRLRVP
jgi:Domain of unknown function (DUF4159)